MFVLDASFDLVLQYTGGHPNVKLVQLNVYDDQRASLTKKSDVVISLLPPPLHILIAKDCLRFAKHLLTAFYVNDPIKALEKDIKAKGVLFLCEMGLNPRIYHMSAMKIIFYQTNSLSFEQFFKEHFSKFHFTNVSHENKICLSNN